MEVFSCFFALRDRLLRDGRFVALRDGLLREIVLRLVGGAASAREESPPGAGKDTQVGHICHGEECCKCDGKGARTIGGDTLPLVVFITTLFRARALKNANGVLGGYCVLLEGPRKQENVRQTA